MGGYNVLGVSVSGVIGQSLCVQEGYLWGNCPGVHVLGLGDDVVIYRNDTYDASHHSLYGWLLTSDTASLDVPQFVVHLEQGCTHNKRQ